MINEVIFYRGRVLSSNFLREDEQPLQNVEKEATAEDIAKELFTKPTNDFSARIEALNIIFAKAKGEDGTEQDGVNKTKEIIKSEDILAAVSKYNKEETPLQTTISVAQDTAKNIDAAIANADANAEKQAKGLDNNVVDKQETPPTKLDVQQEESDDNAEYTESEIEKYKNN